MSAPHSIGRQKIGVGNVLSMISGTPLACATRASFSMSQTESAGLASVSAKTALVLGLKAFCSVSSSASSSMKDALDAHALHRHREQVDRAAVDFGGGDEAVARRKDVEQGHKARRPVPRSSARQPTPPSSAASFSSTYAPVGLEMREYICPGAVRSNSLPICSVESYCIRRALVNRQRQRLSVSGLCSLHAGICLQFP